MNKIKTNLFHSRLALIGASAIGVPALHLALRHFPEIRQAVLVDSDHWNTNEKHKQILSSRNDTGNAKVRTLKNSVHAYNPSIEVRAIQEQVQSTQATQAILSTDFWIVGVDNDASRLDLQILAAKHNKALVDLSAQIIGDEKIGTIRTYVGNKSPCLVCQGLPLHTIMSKTLRQAKIKQGYLQGTNMNPRSVAVLDTAVAAMGVSLLADHLENKRDLPTTLSYNQTRQEITKITFERKSSCKICSLSEKEATSCHK